MMGTGTTARPAGDRPAFTEFGQWLRANLAPVIDTTTISPAGVAETVAAWVRGRLGKLGQLGQLAA